MDRPWAVRDLIAGSLRTVRGLSVGCLWAVHRLFLQKADHEDYLKPITVDYLCAIHRLSLDYPRVVLGRAAGPSRAVRGPSMGSRWGIRGLPMGFPWAILPAG